MKHQAIKYRLKTIEFWILLAILVAGGYFLSQAFSMPFHMRRTIGPGFFPTLILSLMILCVLLSLAQFLRSNSCQIFINFQEGSEEDTTFKSLINGMNSLDGQRLKTGNHTGLGRFSALSAATQSDPRNSLLAVSSTNTQMSAELAAKEHLRRFTPVSMLYFDPYVLVSSAPALPETSRIGIDQRLGDTAFLDLWRHHVAKHTAPNIMPMDVKQLAKALSKGAIDAILLPRSELDTIAVEGPPLTTLESYDDLSSNEADDTPPLVYANWAILFAPDALSTEEKELLAVRLAKAASSPGFQSQLQHAQEPWHVSTADEASQALRRLADQAHLAPTVQVPKGRAFAIPLTLATIAAFPFAMAIIGFILTASIATSIVMALLWTDFKPRVLLTFGVMNVAISVLTYLVFYHIFGIPLPVGSIW